MYPEFSLSVERAIEEIFGESVTIQSSRMTGGGCINDTELLLLSNGENVFLKSNSLSKKGLFKAEAEGLLALSTSKGPRVPKVIGYVESEKSQHLLLECIHQGSPGREFWQDFGRNLAYLHLSKQTDHNGFHMDNHIGETEQVNTPCDSWPEFFGRLRLGYQIELAATRGFADAALVKAVESIIRKLDELLPDSSPVLLHGDLWSGNYMVDETGTAVLIDPAVYYGHFEADLAMTELFGGFGRGFYEGYSEINPISKEYQKRKDLYNLYHMLNHLNLFGRSYEGSVRAIIRKYL